MNFSTDISLEYFKQLHRSFTLNVDYCYQGDIATCAGTYLHLWSINGTEIASINTAVGRNQQILCVAMSQVCFSSFVKPVDKIVPHCQNRV